ncbi:hypothetical protein E6C27_scaffold511G001270 [Cucumis melo var. makuwa]|uniref:Uncharacterized protein n=1 Tax=Cucumis melo var. makuwa TaxID=1194695 RepID=A0A5A7U5N0_CUCMM|nr:hypothetical protein E6C27_scaffold511G001270 [Cucumis melo var. makuwa]
MPIPRMLNLDFRSRVPTSSSVTEASFSSIWSHYGVSNLVSFYLLPSHSFLCNKDENRKLAREASSLSSDSRLVLLLHHPMQNISFSSNYNNGENDTFKRWDLISRFPFYPLPETFRLSSCCGAVSSSSQIGFYTFYAITIKSVVGIYVIKLALQETGVLPTPKNIGENEMYVEKGYPDVQNDVRKNVERKASREAFPTLYQHGVEKASPDAELRVGIACIGSTSFPT